MFGSAPEAGAEMECFFDFFEIAEIRSRVHGHMLLRYPDTL